MIVKIVGGAPDIGKESSIVTKLASNFFGSILYNGHLPIDSIDDADLLIWMPDISNEQEKHYPIKKKGAVLICSKVMREGYTEIDAISRIFKMHANAVIAIYKDEKPFRFKLIDALGNLWCDTTDLSELSNAIIKFEFWSSKQIRAKTIKISTFDTLSEFCKVVSSIADKIQGAGNTGRFYGNASVRTRCSATFPSIRTHDKRFLVSKRNIPKDRLTPEDFVEVELLKGPNDRSNSILVYGEDSPSVDTAIQGFLYDTFPNINYMIHGHAYIENAPVTRNYRPCGDLYEVYEIRKLLRISDDYPLSIDEFAINLKNHGFLIATKNLPDINAYNFIGVEHEL